MDKNQRKLAEARLGAVAKIVERTLVNQPSINVPELAQQLMLHFALNDCAIVVCGGAPVEINRRHRDECSAPKKNPENSEWKNPFAVDVTGLDRSSLEQPIVLIDAPFPESAMGGDSYDPIELTACLPEFDRLPTEFNDKFSAIRTGDKTVVMNSAHYADLLQARDAAIRAREEAEVMKQAAIAAIQPLSDIETIARQTKGHSFVFGNADGTFSVIADDAVETGPNVRQLLRAIAEKITNPVPEVVEIPEVSNETTDQSGVQEVSCEIEPACETAECKTEPVDSEGQTGVTQDTTEKTSNQF